ncbi:LOW QUALITY PROTEIN: receptor expression-enhancing protein 4 [Melanerpes formicivorus]|uniref:LOW QUALITY PROTEIN: receptor expression-enhancing protein 4 n=1 Tax=Melanerpes formicivorus TaxID=211600 RepID=UPI00358FF531
MPARREVAPQATASESPSHEVCVWRCHLLHVLWGQRSCRSPLAVGDSVGSSRPGAVSFRTGSGAGMVLERAKAELWRWGKRLGYSLLLLLYWGWPECLTPSLPCRLLFGMLYPAYASYKAVKSKNIREYVRWMMYWIVFALFMAMETITDLLISWFPFYYELKMAFVLWLLSPYTRGASLLYRKFVHPTLSSREKEIDSYIIQTKERGYQAMVSFGRRGLNLAATAAVQAATKSQGALAGRLRSFSMQDLRSLPDQTPLHYREPLYLEEQEDHRQPARPRAGGRCESETEEEELWSDSPGSSEPPPWSRDPRPPSRSQSLRVPKKKPASKEGSSRPPAQPQQEEGSGGGQLTAPGGSLHLLGQDLHLHFAAAPPRGRGNPTSLPPSLPACGGGGFPPPQP